MIDAVSLGDLLSIAAALGSGAVLFWRVAAWHTEFRLHVKAFAAHVDEEREGLARVADDVRLLDRRTAHVEGLLDAPRIGGQ